jgi:hypothetical protein
LTGKILSAPNNGSCGTTCPDPTYPLEDRVNWKCVDTCKDNLIESKIGALTVCIMCPEN